MPNFNQITVIGHVGTINLEGTYKKFSVAYTRKSKNKEGEKVEETQWFNCTAFNDNLANVIQNYIKKGVAVFVIGTLSSRAYLAKDGTPKISLDIALSNIQVLTREKDTEESVVQEQSAVQDDEIPF